jgi:hypothetical protein
MHDDNEECLKCPSCLSLSALSYLLKIANHLELVKPDPSSSLPQHKRDAQVMPTFPSHAKRKIEAAVLAYFHQPRHNTS